MSFGPSTLSSSYQLVGNLLPQLSKGAAINIMGRWTPETGFAALEQRKATMLIANPPILTDYLDQARAHGRNVLTLRMSMSGGGPVPPVLKAAWLNELKLPLVESYGQSELGGFVALGYPSVAESDATSRRIGPALPDKEVRIRATSTIASFRPGPSARSYCAAASWPAIGTSPKKTAQALRDGWLCTGDIGVMDVDGYCRHAGPPLRAAQGRRQSWYPRDVEEVLAEIAPICLAALVGAAGTDGTRPVAAVTVSDAGSLDAEQCKTILGAKTPYRHRPPRNRGGGRNADDTHRQDRQGRARQTAGLRTGNAETAG